MSDVPIRYCVDFSRLAWLLLPSLLRRPRLVAIVQWLVVPVQNLYARFLAYEANVRRELSYNSQVLRFEQALNDAYDPALRRIYILGSETELEPLYVNFVAERQANPPICFEREGEAPVYLYSWLEFNSQPDFIVCAPAVLNTPQRRQQLHALIRRLKLANKNYLLNFF